MKISSSTSVGLKTMVRSKKGFTLLEVLLVLGILAVIMGLLVPRLTNRQRDAKIEATKISMEGLKQALQLYALDHDGELPKTTDGLAVLNEPKSRDKKWKGPYLEKSPVDAWDQPFTFRNPSSTPRKLFDLISAGPDLTMGTDDDISN
jgi:general secretion pathway protein G